MDGSPDINGWISRYQWMDLQISIFMVRHPNYVGALLQLFDSMCFDIRIVISKHSCCILIHQMNRKMAEWIVRMTQNLLIAVGHRFEAYS